MKVLAHLLLAAPVFATPRAEEAPAAAFRCRFEGPSRVVFARVLLPGDAAWLDLELRAPASDADTLCTTLVRHAQVRDDGRPLRGCAPEALPPPPDNGPVILREVRAMSVTELVADGLEPSCLTGDAVSATVTEVRAFRSADDCEGARKRLAAERAVLAARGAEAGREFLEAQLAAERARLADAEKQLVAWREDAGFDAAELGTRSDRLTHELERLRRDREHASAARAREIDARLRRTSDEAIQLQQKRLAWEHLLGERDREAGLCRVIEQRLAAPPPAAPDVPACRPAAGR